MKVYLCGDSGCCPAVEIDGQKILIGEDDNACQLNRDEWNSLVHKIKTGELKEI